MTRRQRNNQWSGGRATQPAPLRKNSGCKNPLENSRFDFWDQDGILLIDYLPKGQNINTEYYSSLLVQLKDILKEKLRGAGKSPRGSFFARNCPGSVGTCNPQESGLPGIPMS